MLQNMRKIFILFVSSEYMMVNVCGIYIILNISYKYVTD
jgi:hypothetical protein